MPDERQVDDEEEHGATAMAVAGLQVLISGPSVLSRYLDPASGQTFQYQPSEIGFRLTSSFKNNGKPVTRNFRQ